MKILRKISDTLHTITSAMVSILLVILTITSVAGVIFRFILNSPIVWLYEFSILSFAWIIFLGVAMAFKTNEHMNLTFLLNILNSKGRYILSQIINLISLIFMIIALVKGVEIVGGTINQYFNTVPVSKGIFYLSLPVSAIPSIIHILNNMFNLKVLDLPQELN